MREATPASGQRTSVDHPDLGPWEPELTASPHLCATPLDRAFYAGLDSKLGSGAVRTRLVLDSFDGVAVDVYAGEAFSIELLEGAQIVNLFAFNRDDPDERIWMQTLIREGLFLTSFSRLWGTMARYRPLLTLIEDTVTTQPGPIPFAQHHPIFGGSETPADWQAVGGTPTVPSTWEQLAALMRRRDLAPSLLAENVCLFQKSALEPETQRLLILPSDALAGDRLTFFAEIDLCVLLALSPYLDASRQPEAAEVPTPLSVQITVLERIAEPLPWPYQGVSYPDLDSYLDESGVRSDTIVEPVPW